jgi:hypothetical protein
VVLGLLDGFDDVLVQPFMPNRAVVALDVGVLLELSLKVGDGGIGWHIKALLTRRSSRREKDMPHDEGYGFFRGLRRTLIAIFGSKCSHRISCDGT